MIVCIVLIWFLLTVLHESGNLDAIFIVCRKKERKKHLQFKNFADRPPPLFLVSFILFFLALPLGKG